MGWKSTVLILFFNGKRILLLIKIGIEECSRYNSVTFKLLFRNLCFFYLLKKICIDIYEGWTEYNLPSTRIKMQEYFFLWFGLSKTISIKGSPQDYILVEGQVVNFFLW